MAHKTCTAFGAYQTLESRGFFYISKAFDKVWHEGFIFKLKSMGFPMRYWILLNVSSKTGFRELF